MPELPAWSVSTSPVANVAEFTTSEHVAAVPTMVHVIEVGVVFWYTVNVRDLPAPGAVVNCTCNVLTPLVPD